MADVMTVEQRSRIMSRIKGKNTTPERYVHELAEAAGLIFARHEATLPGKPDMAFLSKRIAVFIDGDFWHGWRFNVWKSKLAPRWREKIENNRKRDQRNFRKLRRAGWVVLRIWEHQIEANVVDCIRKIASLAGERIDRASMNARYVTMVPLTRRNRLPKP